MSRPTQSMRRATKGERAVLRRRVHFGDGGCGDFPGTASFRPVAHAQHERPKVLELLV